VGELFDPKGIVVVSPFQKGDQSTVREPKEKDLP
jgi:hypothetical protein